MIDEADKLRLIDAIFDAFADVPHPGRNIAPCGCWECSEVEKDFQDAVSASSWQTLATSIIERHFSVLALLSPRAFNSFLPAFLVYALQNYNASDVWEWTIYTLTPGKESDNSSEWWRERLHLFTEEQMNVIYQYLNLIRQDPDAYDFYKDIDRGKPRLETYFNNKNYS